MMLPMALVLSRNDAVKRNLTTDGHGWTRMKTRAVGREMCHRAVSIFRIGIAWEKSVSIRVHPWLKNIFSESFLLRMAPTIRLLAGFVGALFVPIAFTAHAAIVLEAENGTLIGTTVSTAALGYSGS